jgi:hypothetical protein
MRITGLEGSQASSACPSDSSSIKINMLEWLDVMAGVKGSRISIFCVLLKALNLEWQFFDWRDRQTKFPGWRSFKLFEKIVHTSLITHCVSIIKISWLILLAEIFTICCENRKKLINMPCEQNVKFRHMTHFFRNVNNYRITTVTSKISFVNLRTHVLFHYLFAFPITKLFYGYFATWCRNYVVSSLFSWYQQTF